MRVGVIEVVSEPLRELARGRPVVAWRVSVFVGLVIIAVLLPSGWFGVGVMASERLEGVALRTALSTPGHFIVMRHALAPGVGDPESFRIDDCSTQRNLSDVGRRQARRTGEMLRSVGVSRAKVVSSRWCRCLETARLLNLGPVTPLESLNSFHGQRSREKEQIERLRGDIAAMDLTQPAILVTHQVVISGLAGMSTRSGEIVVMRRKATGEFTVVGSIAARSAE